METSKLKKFAQFARRSLVEQVASKLTQVLKAESPSRRELPTVVAKLEEELKSKGKEQVIEQVAYTWFNRFCALRFMDINGYNRIGVLSPSAGQFQPEILAEAKAGHIDEVMISRPLIREKITNLLNGSIKSHDGQSEAYRLLIVAVCNEYYRMMPYLFERIEDYTELLMPDDLLSGNSILAYTREAMTPETCQDVEIIGWLYQFYISEKKDQVFAGLKKNQKITAENIPAATQLFTPHWIVRYLVENSLGRLWLLNRPQSRLAEQMDYYIAPETLVNGEQPEADFLRIARPEDIRICDPAAGSGHMLTYAFDLLYAIYEEEGYDAAEIPALILTHNLTGVEIDDRAGALAAFALAMKAAAKLGRRRFLRMETKPNICVLHNVVFTPAEIQDVASVMGKELFTDELRQTLGQFEQAKNFGSLIVPKLRDPAETLRLVEAWDFGGDLLLKEVQERVLAVLHMAEVLSCKYYVVVANPPYMGGKGMNGPLGNFLKSKFTDVKSDLFSAFMVRNTQLALPKAQLGFMTPFVWMFISSFEKLRLFLLDRKTITSLIQLEYSGFEGATVPICACTIENSHRPEFRGGYVRLSEFKGSINQAPRALEAIKEPSSSWFYRASSKDFEQIPGRPIAYSASQNVFNAFKDNKPNSEFCSKRLGLCTGNNDEFIRYWYEVFHSEIGFGCSSNIDFLQSGKRYAPHNKGGEFRKWSGNEEYIIKFDEPSFMALSGLCNKLASRSFYFRECITWTEISSAIFSARKLEQGFTFNIKGPSIFFEDTSSEILLGYFCSSSFGYLLSFVNQTLSFNGGDIERIPFAQLTEASETRVKVLSVACRDAGKYDWDAYETSWDFTTLPLLQTDHRTETLEATYTTLRTHWQGMTDEMQRLEEENNRIFIDAYGLADELTPEVPLKEITLTCNPAYSIKGDKTNEEREIDLRKRTIEEFLSYATGCMLGRYSLDAPGLILANQGETLADYLARIPEPSFMPDDDNVIPMIDFDGDWFEDDISERFKQFLKVTFGEENFVENLAFIEEAIGKDIKKYFAKDFYADHVKRYKKRPIYWLFSSPKGTFNALIYMHRYRPDTVSVVLNDYLREFRTKLQARKESYEQIEISASASQKDKTQAIKAIGKINKVLDEVNEYERDILYPLAGQNIEIDLDDGVKHNYPLFGNALKKIVGLS
jgi:type II restriction/modification system DNA methylase subunit YeeA